MLKFQLNLPDADLYFNDELFFRRGNNPFMEAHASPVNMPDDLHPIRSACKCWPEAYLMIQLASGPDLWPKPDTVSQNQIGCGAGLAQ